MSWISCGTRRGASVRSNAQDTPTSLARRFGWWRKTPSAPAPAGGTIFRPGYDRSIWRSRPAAGALRRTCCNYLRGQLDDGSDGVIVARVLYDGMEPLRHLSRALP